MDPRYVGAFSLTLPRVCDPWLTRSLRRFHPAYLLYPRLSLRIANGKAEVVDYFLQPRTRLSFNHQIIITHYHPSITAIYLHPLPRVGRLTYGPLMSFVSALPPEDESARLEALGRDAQLFARASSKRPATDQLLHAHFIRYWNRAYEQGAIDGYLEGHERSRAEAADMARALRLLAGAVPENVTSDNPILKTALTIARSLLYPGGQPESLNEPDPIVVAAERKAAEALNTQQSIDVTDEPPTKSG